MGMRAPEGSKQRGNPGQNPRWVGWEVYSKPKDGRAPKRHRAAMGARPRKRGETRSAVPHANPGNYVGLLPNSHLLCPYLRLCPTIVGGQQRG